MYAYGVYVVQLNKSAGPRQDRRLPWLYVGQSAKSPEERLAQHLEGGSFSSAAVSAYGEFLRPDLYCDLPRVWERDQAERMELERAKLLSSAGYTVRSNGERAFVPVERRVLFDAAMMEAAIDYVDQATFSILARMGRPMSPDDLVRVLWNDGAEKVIAAVQPELPLPEMGRFGHVEPGVLRARLSHLVASHHLQDSAAGELWFSDRSVWTSG